MGKTALRGAGAGRLGVVAPIVAALLVLPPAPALAAKASEGTFTGVTKGRCFTATNFICDFDMVATTCAETFVDAGGVVVSTECGFSVGWNTAGVARTRGNGSSLSCTTSYSTVDATVQAPWLLRTWSTGTLAFIPDVLVNQGAGGTGIAEFTGRISTTTHTVFVEGKLTFTRDACATFDEESAVLEGEFVVFATS